MQRYFVNQYAKEIVLDDVISKHIKIVMKNHIGDNIFLCIENKYYQYQIVSLDNNVIVRLVQDLDYYNELRIKSTLVIPILKKDNHKIAIEKAIELGVDEIILYQGDNSVVKWKDQQKKISKLEQFIVDASRQSFRNKIINISFLPLEKIDFNNYDTCFFGDETKNTISKVNFSGISSVLFISGCEGGFSELEYDFFKSKNVKPISLAKTILRAETAPICFQSILNMY